MKLGNKKSFSVKPKLDFFLKDQPFLKLWKV